MSTTKRGIRSKFQVQKTSTLYRSFQLLSAQDKRRLGIAVAVQSSIAVLDLIGVALIGILGIIGVSGFGVQQSPKSVQTITSFLNLDSRNVQTQATVLALIAAFVLTSRTVLTIILNKKILFFLGRKSADITTSLFSSLLTKSILQIEARSSQEMLFSLTTGVNIVVLGIIGSMATVITDVALLVMLGTGLLIVNPVIAISTFSLFGAVALILYKTMNIRASELGNRNTMMLIESNQKILEAINSFRELVVRNREKFYAYEVNKSRSEFAASSAEIQFMPNYSKYLVEIILVIGAILIGATQFLLGDATQAISTLAIFLASGMRIAPAVMRIQNGAINIKSNIGISTPTLDLIDQLQNSTNITFTKNTDATSPSNFISKLELTNISFSYPGGAIPSIRNLDLVILPGEKVAIVGSSGAGKSTLMDVILGLVEVQTGSVTISGLSPRQAFVDFPGSVSYVPQKISITNGSLAENIAMGYVLDVNAMGRITEVIRESKLREFVDSLQDGLSTKMGENGVNISGGQIQRIGIARALFTKPKLILLDEATSALDGATEAAISEEILNLNSETTVIMIAHRLSAIRYFDKVVYLENGRIKASGTFDEVRKSVPDFDRQAQLMGL